jgi:hypothetical protein
MPGRWHRAAGIAPVVSWREAISAGAVPYLLVATAGDSTIASVFVSYRRDDSQGFAGRLADDLEALLGPDRVFRDVEIPIGSDFSDVLRRAIAASDILLVVIGRNWAAVSQHGYGSRLFEPNDWVRTEIEEAFSQDKIIVPVLVGGAQLPAQASLPASIARLTRLQCAVLTDRRWQADLGELCERLQSLCPALARPQRLRRSGGESPAEVLRELGDRVIDEIGSQRARSAPRRNGPPGLLRRLLGHLLQKLGRLLRQVLTIALVVALGYGGLRLFGDEATLRSLDAVEARLQVGWDRLQRYLERL